MTLVRKLAVKMSEMVMRMASPGAKEWADASSREIGSIGNDWTALWWSLGSLRILLDRSEAPMLSVAEVPQAAMRFAKTIQRRTILGLAVCVFIAVRFRAMAHWQLNEVQRTGSYMIVASVVYMAFQLWARRDRLSSRSGSPASADSYRLELARQRDFHRGGWLWTRVIFLVSACLVFSIGGAMAHPEQRELSIRIGISFLVLGVGAVIQNFRRARNYQRKMDELEAVVKAGG